tara:strand:- start:204 stop:488 length:285 start_codon:yes stop_codon:yes gene_type:complete
MTNNIESKINNNNITEGISKMSNTHTDNQGRPYDETTWRRHTIYLPDIEEVEQIKGENITIEEYNEIIDDLVEHLTYDEYKEPFLEMIETLIKE